jgi:hypothetical protein
VYVTAAEFVCCWAACYLPPLPYIESVATTAGAINSIASPLLLIYIYMLPFMPWHQCHRPRASQRRTQKHQQEYHTCLYALRMPQAFCINIAIALDTSACLSFHKSQDTNLATFFLSQDKFRHCCNFGLTSMQCQACSFPAGLLVVGSSKGRRPRHCSSLPVMHTYNAC